MVRYVSRKGSQSNQVLSSYFDGKSSQKRRLGSPWEDSDRGACFCPDEITTLTDDETIALRVDRRQALRRRLHRDRARDAYLQNHAEQRRAGPSMACPWNEAKDGKPLAVGLMSEAPATEVAPAVGAVAIVLNFLRRNGSPIVFAHLASDPVAVL